MHTEITGPQVHVADAPRLLLRRRDAAEVLGLSANMLDELDDLKSLKIGRARRWHVDELRRWARAQADAAEGNRHD